MKKIQESHIFKIFVNDFSWKSFLKETHIISVIKSVLDNNYFKEND